MNIKDIVLDTRELEAPEPMGVVLDNLKLLNETTYILMIHRLEPQMLFVHLDRNNLNYKITFKNEDIFIYIWDDSFKKKDMFKEMK